MLHNKCLHRLWHIYLTDNFGYEMTTFTLEHFKKKVMVLLVQIKFLGAVLLHRQNFFPISSK
jgi:hypothetical protein